MVGFLNVCRFNVTAGGLTDWTVSSAVTGYQTPSSAGATNGTVYAYRAESADLTQWEIGVGAYATGTGVLARSTVRASSTGSKVNFSAAPQVAIVGLAEEVANLSAQNLFTDATNASSTTAGGALNVAGGIASNGLSYLKNLVVGSLARDAINASFQMENQILHIGVGPTQSIKATGGGADQKYWDIVFSPTNITYRALNDIYSAANGWLSVNRGSGYTIANVNLLATTNVGAGEAATSTSTGALRVSGGAGVSGSIYAGGGVVAPAFSATASPAASWHLDGSATAITIANGANAAAVPAGSGLLVIRMGEGLVNGAVIMCSGGGAVICGQVGTMWEVGTTTPAAGHASVAFDGVGTYRIYNNQGASQNFHIATIRCFSSP